MYPEEMCTPMRLDLVDAGFQEMKTAEDVDQVLGQKSGSVLVMINSVCGCAAGNARPAVKMASKHSKVPTKLTTVFAGQDKDAVAKVRDFCLPYPPSSPSIALFKDGDLVHFIERHHIEGRPAEMIAENLMAAFDENC
jgi:putative YphP/YqiW family bacilliredoxin